MVVFSKRILFIAALTANHVHGAIEREPPSISGMMLRFWKALQDPSCRQRMSEGIASMPLWWKPGTFTCMKKGSPQEREAEFFSRFAKSAYWPDRKIANCLTRGYKYHELLDEAFELQKSQSGDAEVFPDWARSKMKLFKNNSKTKEDEKWILAFEGSVFPVQYPMKLKTQDVLVDVGIYGGMLPDENYGGQDTAGVFRCAKALLENYDVDYTKLSITGHSLGGTYALRFLQWLSLQLEETTTCERVVLFQPYFPRPTVFQDTETGEYTDDFDKWLDTYKYANENAEKGVTMYTSQKDFASSPAMAFVEHPDHDRESWGLKERIFCHHIHSTWNGTTGTGDSSWCAPSGSDTTKPWSLWALKEFVTAHQLELWFDDEYGATMYCKGQLCFTPDETKDFLERLLNFLKPANLLTRGIKPIF